MHAKQYIYLMSLWVPFGDVRTAKLEETKERHVLAVRVIIVQAVYNHMLPSELN